jgi:hypothetical protein
MSDASSFLSAPSDDSAAKFVCALVEVYEPACCQFNASTLRNVYTVCAGQDIETLWPSSKPQVAAAWQR